MNDDELGRALGTVLAAPDLHARADAGPRLRERAARQRRDRGMVGGTVVLVFGILLAVGVVRGTGGGAPTTPAAAPTGFSRLSTPLAVVAADSPEPCPAPGQPAVCKASPLLSVEVVAGWTTSDLPERGVAVTFTLITGDAAVLESATKHPQYERIQVWAAGEALPATTSRAQLRITADSTQTADRLLTAVDPVPLRAPELGPGRLTRPLRVAAASSTAGPPCKVYFSAVPGYAVVTRAEDCLTLREPDLNGGAGFMIRSADLSIREFPAQTGSWSVRVVPSPDVSRLIPVAGGGTALVFLVDDVPLQVATSLGPDNRYVDLVVNGRPEAAALAALLRS